MEQAGALKCGLLPVISKTSPTGKMQDFKLQSLILFSNNEILIVSSVRGQQIHSGQILGGLQNIGGSPAS